MIIRARIAFIRLMGAPTVIAATTLSGRMSAGNAIAAMSGTSGASRPPKRTMQRFPLSSPGAAFWPVQVLVICVVMSFIIYALIGLMPGDPVDLMITADPHLTKADVARLKELYGLNRPLAERYLAWAQAALAGDFGYSRLYRMPTIEVMLPRLGLSRPAIDFSKVDLPAPFGPMTSVRLPDATVRERPCRISMPR